MPGNTKQLKKDVDQKPAPQYFDPVLDEYGYLYGSNGATRHIIYGANGEPISTTGNKLAVRATEMETTLGTLLTKTGFDAKVDLALSALRDALRGTGNKSLTDLATAQAALAAVIGEAAAAPTANTILARLKSLEDKIDAITTGTSPAVTQLTGSIETVVDNPATGIKTITTTAAELFAGAYAKTNRRKLIIKNEDQSLRFRIGKADITQQNGFPVEPGAVVIIPFDPAVIVPIYAISEGASLQASVMEV